MLRSGIQRRGLILISALLPQSGDRFNINSQLEHLQQKYVGTGHADASKLCVAPFPGPRFPVPCPLPRFPAARESVLGAGEWESRRPGPESWRCGRSEWAVNMRRDSSASYIGHNGMLAYFGVAENESIGRVQFNFVQSMLAPCGAPPAKDDA